jgi:hypothetical protein
LDYVDDYVVLPIYCAVMNFFETFPKRLHPRLAIKKAIFRLNNSGSVVALKPIQSKN